MDTRVAVKMRKIWRKFAGRRAIGYHLRLRIPPKTTKIGGNSQKWRADDPPKYNRYVITDPAALNAFWVVAEG